MKLEGIINVSGKPGLHKIISKGKNRGECIMRLKRALDEYVIEGIETNIQVLKKILSHQEFLEAKFDINWYDRLNS